MEILNKIQKELKAPRGQFNSFAKFNYRSCEDIVEAVKPLLGSAVLTLSDEVVNIGNRYYVKATATIQDGEVSKSVSAFAREQSEKKGMDEAQVTGSASSYARKYALNGLFAIDDTKDADTQDNTKNEPTVQYAPTAKATVTPKKTPFEMVVEMIQKATTAEELADLAEKVTNSAKYTDEQKADLQDSIEARASLI